MLGYREGFLFVAVVFFAAMIPGILLGKGKSKK